MDTIERTCRSRRTMSELPIGIKIPVLDDGFIILIDTMGDDSAIVDGARTSLGEDHSAFSRAENRNLIRYLIRHKHTSPLEMCEIKLKLRIPMDCWRQMIRHRTANVNEYSTRYRAAIDSAARIDSHEWRIQHTNIKQGSAGFLHQDIGQKLTEAQDELLVNARRVYERRLTLGVAREQARKDLPLSTYTEAIWKIDLHNLLHFLKLRLDDHAQWEIRQYAEAIAEIVKVWVPTTWEAFNDYILEGISLSLIEQNQLMELIKISFPLDGLPAEENGFYLSAKKNITIRGREKGEFLEKLKKILERN